MEGRGRRWEQSSRGRRQEENTVSNLSSEVSSRVPRDTDRYQTALEEIERRVTREGGDHIHYGGVRCARKIKSDHPLIPQKNEKLRRV